GRRPARPRRKPRGPVRGEPQSVQDWPAPRRTAAAVVAARPVPTVAGPPGRLPAGRATSAGLPWPGGGGGRLPPGRRQKRSARPTVARRPAGSLRWSWRRFQLLLQPVDGTAPQFADGLGRPLHHFADLHEGLLLLVVEDDHQTVIVR